MRHSQRRLAFLDRHLGFVEVDPVGTVRSVNPCFATMAGQAAEVLVGRSLPELLAPEDRSLCQEAWAGLRHGRSIEALELRLIQGSGALFSVAMSCEVELTPDGRPLRVFAVVQDVDRYRRAADRWRDLEERYRLVVEHASDAVFVAQDGEIKFPNPRALELLGGTEDQLKGVPFSHFIHPEDRDMVLQRYRRRLEGDRARETYAFRIVNRRGTTIWGRLDTMRITWEGRPATLNFFHDLSENKRLEAKFQRAQKMEAIGTLAGGVAHDFNNVLTGILGHVSLMLRDVDSTHPFYSRLQAIDEYVDSGAELARQLLGFARGGHYEVKATDLGRLIRRGVELFARTRKELEIEQRFDPQLWLVEIDRGQIGQALLNLYVNAWQAMPGGGVLTIGADNVTIDPLEAEALGVTAGSYVRVAVGDTGHGMDDDTRQRIFEPFFTTKGKGHGTGLGLASVYAAVTHHGGAVEVRSTEGRGSVFEVFLPASPGLAKVDDEPSDSTDDPPVDPPVETETVLVVDDEVLILEITGEMLRQLGYRVYLARSGVEAMELLAKDRAAISLVVLDMVMPGMSGRETFDRLKAMAPSLRVLLASGYSLNAEARSILEQGCDGFIQKPFRFEPFSQKIRSILED